MELNGEQVQLTVQCNSSYKIIKKTNKKKLSQQC